MLPAKKAGSTPTPPSFAAQAGRRWTCCFPPQSFADSAVRRKATSPAKERLPPITIRLQPSCLLFLDDSENSHHGSRLHAGRRSEKSRTGSVMPCVSGTCSRTPGRRKPKAPRQRAATAAYLNAAVTAPERPLSRTPEEAQAPCLRPSRLPADPETRWGIPHLDEALAQVVTVVHSQTYCLPSEDPDGPAAGSDQNYATPLAARCSHAKG